MIDVHLPTTDGREIVLTRYTEPEPELRLLIDRMKLALPAQPPPKIAAAALPRNPPVVKTFSVKVLISLTAPSKIGPIREVGLEPFGLQRQEHLPRFEFPGLRGHPRLL
jgi:hypothetical protein